MREFFSHGENVLGVIAILAAICAIAYSFVECRREAKKERELDDYMRANKFACGC